MNKSSRDLRSPETLRPAQPRQSWLRRVVVAVACIAAGWGLFRLASAQSGLQVTHESVQGTPVTIFTAGDGPAPVIVIAHGFAGSQQLMQPFAITLARSGYLVVTYDLLGHGRNPAALTGDVTKVEGATANLLAELDRVVTFARALPGSDGRIALLGHSMSTDLIVRYAIAHPDVAASVAVSMFSPAVTANAPKNLLVIVGEWETALRAEALRALALLAGVGAEEGKTYGDFSKGTARRVAVAANVEHIGVLYNGQSLTEARDWLNAVFDRAGDAPVETRGLPLLLLFAGMAVIAGFTSRVLPRAAKRLAGLGPGWRTLAPLGIVPAFVTPLLLWKAPTDLLPVPVGGYLAAHFFVYGMLTLTGLFMTGRSRRQAQPRLFVGNAFLGILAVTLFSAIALYMPLDSFVTSFIPSPSRLPLVVAMLVGLLPYFVADEWLTRGPAAPRGAYAFTKACFLLSLALAIALNFDKLFFLVIIVPVILVFFLVFGLVSSSVYRQTRHPIVGAVANAILFAWAIAVTFPVLGT